MKGSGDAKADPLVIGGERFFLNAPFNELCPAAVDPMIVDVAKMRYKQTFILTCSYGIGNMIVHQGYIPTFYSNDWFVSHSII